MPRFVIAAFICVDAPDKDAAEQKVADWHMGHLTQNAGLAQPALAPRVYLDEEIPTVEIRAVESLEEDPHSLLHIEPLYLTLNAT